MLAKDKMFGKVESKKRIKFFLLYLFFVSIKSCTFAISFPNGKIKKFFNYIIK